jgi:alpha-glucosidase (family GH31 glycosyl hydrolase)
MAESFTGGQSEHYSGLGGRMDAVDQSGQAIQQWAEEGVRNPQDRALVLPFVEPWTWDDRSDGTYFPMPWLVSSRGYGFLLDDSQLSLFRLRSGGSPDWDIEANDQQLDYRVFSGPTPLDVVRRFSAAVGRQPAPAAPWVLGPWWQPSGSNPAALPAQMRKQDVPGSLLETYTHYLPCGDQVGHTAQEKARAAAGHAAGYAVTTYFNPMICDDYSPVFGQAQSAGALLDDAAGAP